MESNNPATFNESNYLPEIQSGSYVLVPYAVTKSNKYCIGEVHGVTNANVSVVFLRRRNNLMFT